MTGRDRRAAGDSADQPAAAAADVDEQQPSGKRGAQAMLRAVNRDLRLMPEQLQRSALAELARQLARRFDGGDEKATPQLRATLESLLRHARAAPAGPPAAPPPPAGDQVDEPEAREGDADERRTGDPLNTIRANRAVRRSRRADRTPAAADMDGSEPGS